VQRRPQRAGVGIRLFARVDGKGVEMWHAYLIQLEFIGENVILSGATHNHS
jgi:hypothetical protein